MATIPLSLDRPRHPPEGDITFKEFLALVPDGTQADLLDGVIYMASPDNLDANKLNTWLTAVIVPFVEAHDLGEVYILRAWHIGWTNEGDPSRI